MSPRPRKVARKIVNPAPSEHTEQVWLFQWMELSTTQWPELECAFAIPNFAGHHGSAVSRIVSGKKAKDEGRKAGVPDIFLPVARGRYHGMFIEMKKQNGRVKPEQLAWGNRLRAQGYHVVVCAGFEAARQAILDYLRIPV